MRRLALLLLLTPFCVGWNGSGPAVTDIAGDGQKQPDQYRSEAVCAAHDDRVEVIIVVPLEGEGDGVLSLRFDRSRINREVDLPSALVRARYREYGADGETRFRGVAVSSGFAVLSGDLRGALDLTFDAVFTDGARERRVVSDARLLALDWSPAGGRRQSVHNDDAPDGYYEGGCSGNYYESDYEDDTYNESYEDGGGCGGDDLDDAPADDSGGGCAGDDDDFSSDSDASADTGCGGDDYESDSDSGTDSGCEGDDLEDAVVGLIRGSGGGPWIGRLVRWLPWMCVFLALRLMRRRRPGQLSQPA